MLHTEVLSKKEEENFSLLSEESGINHNIASVLLQKKKKEHCTTSKHDHDHKHKHKHDYSHCDSHSHDHSHSFDEESHDHKEHGQCCKDGKNTSIQVNTKKTCSKSCCNEEEPREAPKLTATCSKSCCSPSPVSIIKTEASLCTDACCIPKETHSHFSHVSKCTLQCCSDEKIKDQYPVLIQVDADASLANIKQKNYFSEFSIQGLHCSDCALMVENKLKTFRGMMDAKVIEITNTVQIWYDSLQLEPSFVMNEISKLGYPTVLLSTKDLRQVTSAKEEPLKVFFKAFPSLGYNIVEQLERAKWNGITSISKVRDCYVNVQYNPEETGVRTILKFLHELSNDTQFQLISDDEALGLNRMQYAKKESIQMRNRLIIAFLLTFPIMFISFVVPYIPYLNSWILYELIPRLMLKDIILFFLCTPIQCYVAWPFYVSSFKAIVYGRTLNMDCLVILSTSVAYFYSIISVLIAIVKPDEVSEAFFETSAMLLTFIVIGRYLEIVVKGQTSNILQQILKLQASSAMAVEYFGQNKEQVIEYPLEMLHRNDICKILPGSKVPTDGQVIQGITSIDESMITGESIPVEKQVGDKVFGSTINQNGTIYIKVTKVAKENMLSNIDKLIHEAQTTKAPIQRIADTIAAYFVIIIVLLSIAVFALWCVLGYFSVIPIEGNIVTFALKVAITVLVVSCPCAFSLAAPTALMVGIKVATKYGILFKSGPLLESAHKMNTIVFDKTGSLTLGKLQVESYLHISSEISETEALSFVLAAEKNSEHLIAKAISTYSSESLNKQDNSLPTIINPDTVEAIVGKGIIATFQTRKLVGGNKKFLEENQIYYNAHEKVMKWVQQYQTKGDTLIFFALDSKLLNCFALSDLLRPEAGFVVNELQKQKKQVWIMSGDAPHVVESIAKDLNISNFVGSMLPQDKLESIVTLQDKEKRQVAMIGDGINDAASITKSNLGFAVGAGSDLTLESADVVLMKSDLRDVLIALDISKVVYRLIIWNFIWAIGYNIISIPLAGGVLYPLFGVTVPPALAGLSEIASSIPVVLFSLALQFYKPKPKILK